MAADPVVAVEDAPPALVASGAAAEAAVQLRIAPGFHIQANPASGPFLIPASLELRGEEGIRVKRPIYPPGGTYRLQGTEDDLMTYGGTVNIRLPITAAKTAAPGTHTLRGALRYQACDDRSCLFPASIPVTLTIHVSSTPGNEQGDPSEEEA